MQETLNRQQTDRVLIADNYHKTNRAVQIFGYFVIYLPILLLPFMFLSSILTWWHLKLIGMKNIKTYWDFVPDQSSHRYNLKTQITPDASFYEITASKLFWIFNCTRYCPYSVALFRWHGYLVKIVENFWCPFNHEQKHHYDDGAIDASYWHLAYVNREKLHEDDKNNPIWS